MRDLDIELESQDDEIIELEDIIEMPARPIDEDEDLDLDVEILDVDSYLESEPEKPAKKAAQPFMKEQAQKPPLKQEDLFESFGDESEEDEMLFEPVASREPAKKTMQRAETKVLMKRRNRFWKISWMISGCPSPARKKEPTCGERLLRRLRSTRKPRRLPRLSLSLFQMKFWSLRHRSRPLPSVPPSRLPPNFKNC